MHNIAEGFDAGRIFNSFAFLKLGVQPARFNLNFILLLIEIILIKMNSL